MAGLAASGAAAAAWVVSAPRPLFHASDEPALSSGDADRGKRIFDAAACASCHARPGQSNRLLLGGGLALPSPFGTFYPPNISQDRKDGIGAWSAVAIANAVMSGVSPKGTHYYPALPYVDYAQMRPQDMADLIAYLRTLPPIAGGTPAHDLPAPFRIRRAVGLWKALYLRQRTLQPDPAHEAAWNRGRYLVHVLSHCGECHSAHNMLDAVKEDARFAGGIDQSGVGFVPNITPAGIGHWSAHDLVASLATGYTPAGRKLANSMADVVLDTAALPEEDRVAIATYLKSLPPRKSPEAVKQR
ncbi:MAG: c-type cytochrome [Acetobacteraceae bacterium]|nr:c-type cytochrome [Acetobacteraceae bacterium]